MNYSVNGGDFCVVHVKYFAADDSLLYGSAYCIPAVPFILAQKSGIIFGNNV